METPSVAVTSKRHDPKDAVYCFVGADGEMTGGTKTLDFFKEFALIQVGVALTLDNVFVSDVGHDEWKQTDEAMEVNKFTAERIRAAPRPLEVDRALVKWLFEKISVPPNTRLKLIPVGWNVGSWDVPFFRYWLPEFGRLLWYRMVDLNSVVFTAEKVTGRSYDKIKDSAKRYAVRELKRPKNFHDAGYDAAASLAAWEYLVKLLGGWWHDGSSRARQRTV